MTDKLDMGESYGPEELSAQMDTAIALDDERDYRRQCTEWARHAAAAVMAHLMGRCIGKIPGVATLAPIIQRESPLTPDETLDLLANLKVAATICESYVPDMKTHERLRHYIDKLGGG